MLIVAGSFEVDPARRELYLKERLEMMRRSRDEPGCLEYTFAADPLDAGRVILFERWENDEALQGHLTALRSAPSAAGPQERALSSEIIVYEVGSSRPLN